MVARPDLTRLARPIPPKYVQPPAKGKYGSYVPHDVITQILLTIVGPFDFKVEQIVYGKEGMVEGVTASMTVTIDGWPTTITEVGDCEQPTVWKTQGARMKDAASDALKRCAMRFGLGLSLREKDGNYFLFDALTKAPEGPAPSENAAPSADSPPPGVAASPHLEPRS